MTSILLVDDEPGVNDIGTMILENQGYEVTALYGGPEALALFRKQPRAFDLVITDYMMPEMKGDELAFRLRGIRQDLPVILCTGYGVPAGALEKWGIEALLEKPYSIREMTCLVRDILAGTGRKTIPGIASKNL
ncbi:MAG: response regulator [Desulfobacterales bacterium]|nr:response regulator [Desulfobacterales bacterium]